MVIYLSSLLLFKVLAPDQAVKEIINNKYLVFTSGAWSEAPSKELTKIFKIYYFYSFCVVLWPLNTRKYYNFGDY